MAIRSIIPILATENLRLSRVLRAWGGVLLLETKGATREGIVPPNNAVRTMPLPTLRLPLLLINSRQNLLLLFLYSGRVLDKAFPIRIVLEVVLLPRLFLSFSSLGKRKQFS